jgi:multiple sugar transport system substrate-binding protein
MKNPKCLLRLFVSILLLLDSTVMAETTIRWCSPNWESPMNQELIDAFEAQNPEIKVKLIITEWESYKTKATVYMMGKNSPEIFNVLDTDVREFYQNGLIHPIEEMTATEGMDWNDIVASLNDSITQHSTKYAVPYRLDGDGVYYNADILAKAGYNSFPATLDELNVLNSKLLALGYVPTTYGFGNQANGVHGFVQVLYTFGGRVFDKNGKCILNTEEAKKAMQYIAAGFSKGYISKSCMEHNNSDFPNLIGSGRIVYYISGAYDISTLQTNYPKLNFKTAVIPGVNGIGATAVSAWVAVLAENSINKKAAAKFLAFLGRPENQAKLTATFPASNKALKDKKFNTAKNAPFVQQFSNGAPAPSCTKWAEIEPVIYSYIQQAVSGAMSVEDATKNMTKDINLLIDTIN